MELWQLCYCFAHMSFDLFNKEVFIKKKEVGIKLLPQLGVNTEVPKYSMSVK